MATQNRLRAAVSSLGAQRRQSARRQRRLERELAGYRTPAERLELDAILARHSAEETHDIAEILRHQDNLRALTAQTPHHAGVRA